MSLGMPPIDISLPRLTLCPFCGEAHVHAAEPSVDGAEEDPGAGAPFVLWCEDCERRRIAHSGQELPPSPLW